MSLRLAGAIVAGVVLVAGATAWAATRDPAKPTLASARQVIADDNRFFNGPSSGKAFANVSVDLFQDGRTCSHRFGAGDARCKALLAGAAYANAAAFAVTSCTRPGVYKVRQALTTYLNEVAVVEQTRGLAAAGHGFDARVPDLPGVPTC